MKLRTHIDTRRLIFDQALEQRLTERTSPPDRNGCMFYSKHFLKHIAAKTEDETLAVSVLRVAFVFAGRGHVSEQEEVAHCACGNNGVGDRPLCVAPDHLDKIPRKERTRIMRRAGHLARMRRTLPQYGRPAQS